MRLFPIHIKSMCDSLAMQRSINKCDIQYLKKYGYKSSMYMVMIKVESNFAVI